MDKLDSHKIIFLDFDGVLNTEDSRKYNLIGFDPDLVDNLFTILKTTGAKIVISSSWKFGGYNVGSDIYKAFSNSCKYLTDGTQKFNTIIDSIIGITIDAPCTREQEILYYVEEFGITNFIAIDDMAEHFPSKPDWLILTDDRDGLDCLMTKAVIDKLT